MGQPDAVEISSCSSNDSDTDGATLSSGESSESSILTSFASGGSCSSSPSDC